MAQDALSENKPAHFFKKGKAMKTTVVFFVTVVSLFYCVPVWAQQEASFNKLAEQLRAAASTADRLAATQQPAAPPTTVATATSRGCDPADCPTREEFDALKKRVEAHERRLQKVETRLGQVIRVPAAPAIQSGTSAAVITSVPGTPPPPTVKKDHVVVLRFSGEVPKVEDVALMLRKRQEGYTIESVVWLPPGSDKTAREVGFRSDPVWGRRDALLDQAAAAILSKRIASDAEARDAAAKLPAGTMAYAVMRAP